jgi:DNA-binding transcriptional LysR family regulator
MLSRFDLTDLRLFLMVVEQGSLTRGSEAMHLALASASERISGMESVLGAPLLERTRRGVHPTAAGEALVRHARLILGQAEQMYGELRNYAAGLRGRIRLLCNTAALHGFLPERLCHFLKNYPDLSVDVEEQPSAEIVRAIAEGKAELGLVADIADLTGLQIRLIAEDQLVVVRRAHLRYKERSTRFLDVVEESFVGLSDAALEVHLGEHASRLGRHLNFRARLRSVSQVAMLVEAGVGIAILPKACTEELSKRGLSISRLVEPWAFRKLCLCARDFSVLAPHVKLLAQQFVDLAGGTDPLLSSDASERIRGSRARSG